MKPTISISPEYINRSLVKLAFVGVVGIILVLVIGIVCRSMDFRSAVERGLEQRMVPGSTDPVWSWPETPQNPFGGQP